MKKNSCSQRRAMLLTAFSLCVAIASISPSMAFRGAGRRIRSVPHVIRRTMAPFAASLGQLEKPPVSISPAVSKVVSPAPAGASKPSRPTAARRQHASEDVPSTMPKAMARFFLGKERGPILVLGSLIYMAEWRVGMGPITPADLGAFVSMNILWIFQEHFFHQRLLHSDFDWLGKQIHEDHHDKPYFHISIDPAPLMLGWLATAHFMLRAALPLPLAISATLGYAASGLLYEWAHYIVHTRVKPKRAFWKRVRDNHIRHHQVDERYWLSFTIPAVDDLFGTNPPLSKVRAEARKDAEQSEKKKENRPRENLKALSH